MGVPIKFCLNRISAPRLSWVEFVALCTRLEVDAAEIRNDLNGIELADGALADAVAAVAATAKLTLRSINALQRFDQFDAQREREANALAQWASDCGVQALVLCPTNSRSDRRNAADRHEDLVAAIKALLPILTRHGLQGLIEPLGFEECALRRKSDALRAILEAGGEGCYRLVHDTFHHRLAGEEAYFAEFTGLVHISGVENSTLRMEQMRDADRVLVGPGDRLGNLQQLNDLFAQGYSGYVSFEPFAEEIAQADDIEVRLKESMGFIRSSLTPLHRDETAR